MTYLVLSARPEFGGLQCKQNLESLSHNMQPWIETIKLKVHYNVCNTVAWPVAKDSNVRTTTSNV
jgi:hypothetical protein